MKHSNFDDSQLSPVKQQLLQQLLQEKLASRSVPPIQVIPHIAEQEDAPLSFAQQRLWFLDQLGASNSPYHMPVASHLKGSLHLQALEKSIEEIVHRHSVLRTIFVNQDGHPVQVVRASIDLKMLVIDLTAFSASAQEHKISQLMRSEAQRPFDLAHGPLLRITLLRLQHDEYILQATFHHIVTDGWSLGVFTEELSKFYTAFVGSGGWGQDRYELNGTGSDRCRSGWSARDNPAQRRCRWAIRVGARPLPPIPAPPTPTDGSHPGLTVMKVVGQREHTGRP